MIKGWDKKLIAYKKLFKVSSKVTQYQKRCQMKIHKNPLKPIKVSMTKQGNDKITKQINENE